MTPHPATYTDALLPIFAELLLKSHGSQWGQGTRAGEDFGPLRGYQARSRACAPGFQHAEFYGYEIEPEWAEQARAAGCITTTGDSRQMHYPDAMFDAICTSPTYGNRMADHHEARDASPRHTYRHVLGRPLTPGNSGALQWGEASPARVPRCTWRSGPSAAAC